MINYDSILSAFDGKPTLLQWLKMVKKALDESILKSVDIAQNGEKVVFTFKFEDGTSISTPEVTLPKGDKGDKGENGVSVLSFTFDSYQVLANNTETTYKMTLSNGTETNFVIFAKNGLNGNDGVSITGINTVSSEVVGNETLTTLRTNYSNNTTSDFVVKAKNGKDAECAIYSHIAYLYDDNYINYIYFKVYSHKQTLNLNDILDEIPTVPGSSLQGQKRTYVCFNNSTDSGVVSAGKYLSGDKYYIFVDGVVYDGSNVKNVGTNFLVSGFGSQLLG